MRFDGTFYRRACDGCVTVCQIKRDDETFPGRFQSRKARGARRGIDVRTAVVDRDRPGDRRALHRAGCPQSIVPWAYLSYNNSYDGYYVGGGALCHGDPTWFPCDGVWGWDYFGRHLDRHVALGWWHGRKYQQGGGTYATDGPKVVHHE